MPALQTVSITGTHVDAYKPTYMGYGVWKVKTPDNAASCVANTTTEVVCQFNFTIPNDYALLIMPIDDTNVVGVTNATVKPGMYINGGNQPIRVNVMNITGVAAAPTANTDLCYLVLVKNNIKLNITDPL